MGTSGGEIRPLLLVDTQDRMEALLAQEGQMGKGAERAIPHEPVPWTPRRMKGRHLGHVMGVPGGGAHLQQEACAGMKQGEHMGHGEPTSRPLSAGLAKLLLEFRRIEHRETGPVDQEGAVAPPPPLLLGRLSQTAAVRRSNCSKKTSGKRVRA